MELLIPHGREVVLGGEGHVEEPLDAVGQTVALGAVENVALDVGGDAFLPADVGEEVGFFKSYKKKQLSILFWSFFFLGLWLDI